MITTTINKMIKYVFLAGVVFVAVAPIVWLFFTGLKPNMEIFKNPWLPSQEWMFENLIEAWKIGNFTLYMRNSVIVVALTDIIIILCATPAAYAFSRFKFFGSNALFFMFLIGLMIPHQLVLVPLFLTMRTLGLLNNLFSLIFTYVTFGLPFSIFLMRSAFIPLPKEMEDVAKIDGCSDFRTFVQIMLPLVKPTVAALIIFNTLWAWKEFLFALTFIKETEMMTVPLGLMAFRGEYAAKWNIFASGLFMANLPILIAYFIFQRQFISGLTVGALKG